MKKKYWAIGLLLTLIVNLNFTSCDKDEEIPLYKELNDFIWDGLNSYYLWVANVPQLSENNFTDDAAWKAFKYKNIDSEAFFYSLLYQRGVIDKFSWIVDDYDELAAMFEGITKSTGAVFGATPLRDSKYAAIVLYTVKGGPADIAGIKRGDIFSKIDNTDITTANYSDLYNAENYSLSYATITDSVAILTEKVVQLTAVEVHENPIYLDTVYTIENKKIGYLVYNGFMSDYDIELNDVFAKFKTEQIDELVLDLRYNLGGSGQSATYLASMIKGNNTSDIFYKVQCNELFGNYIIESEGANALNTYFADNIVNETSGVKTAINRLNLSNVHIIATGSSASASEMIINCLRPYANVTTVGSTTIGKYVGSLTLKDYIANGVVNPRHKWAMQPIVFKVANKDGVSDYATGLVPDIYARETRDNMKAIGDTSEILLKTAINDILGIAQNQSLQRSSTGRSMVLSKEFAPFATELHFNAKKYGIDKFKNFR